MIRHCRITSGKKEDCSPVKPTQQISNIGRTAFITNLNNQQQNLPTRDLSGLVPEPRICLIKYIREISVSGTNPLLHFAAIDMLTVTIYQYKSPL